VDALAAMVEESRHTVIFTGAGISTSCGISDFRGPDGVWTREQKGEVAVDPHNAFNHAIPSFAHNAIACLLHAGIFTHLVSQNVDGLHLRSGVSEAQLSELHGNIFKERCTECGKEYMRDEDVGGMGLKPTGRTCDAPKGASSSSSRISTCGGVLVDMAVDWDTTLPAHIFKQAHAHMDRADVVICLGSSLRIHPAGNMPLRALKPKVVRQGRVGKVVVVNLQKTHLDKKCLKVNHYCDEVMRRLCGRLGVQL
ncbi:DHS-like NAD/FAD-binding domain-containing protein, partial [Ochromonadaceae sp. CCMP2298]